MVGKQTQAIVAAALCGMTISAFAETNADVQAELAQLRAEVAAMKAAQGDNWLNERRAEEVKGLVREVLADADTRASLLQEGAMAGHDGKKFFLQSADGSTRLNIEGQIQLRYVVNYQEDRDDEIVNGGEIRRTKLGFNGNIASPKIGYDLVLAVDRETGDVFLEDAIVSYDLTDSLEILAGKAKLPFTRQELLSGKRQLAVERASVHEYFTLNRAEQIQLQYTADMFKVMAALSDGANTEHSAFAEVDADFAATGRVDVKLAGDWKEAADVVAWEDELAAFVGGAVHFESADEDAGAADGDFWAATVDALVKTGPISGLGAFYYADADEELGGPEDAWGVQLEAGYSLTEQWQPFARWEYLDVDGLEDEVQMATLGVNYFLKGHAAKFTVDGVWKYAGGNPSTLGSLNGGEYSSGLGLQSGGVTDEDDQIAIRAQFQLLF